MTYALTLVAAPAAEPITLEEAKAHLRVDGTDEDRLIDALIVAARQHVEDITNRALVTQTWDLTLDAFPCSKVLELPKPPLQSVTSVTYTDSNGDAGVWAASNYLVDAAGFVGRLTPAYGLTWPSFTPAPLNAVRVRFVSGYGLAAAVPQPVKHALLLLVGHWYTNREAVFTGSITKPIEFAVDALLAPYRVLSV